MDAVKIDISPQENASRVELVIRFFYMIPLFIVMYIISIVAMIGIVINFFTSLILGKRIAALNNFIAMYIRYNTEFITYLYLTDERPEIIPKM